MPVVNINDLPLTDQVRVRDKIAVGGGEGLKGLLITQVADYKQYPIAHMRTECFSVFKQNSTKTEAELSRYIIYLYTDEVKALYPDLFTSKDYKLLLIVGGHYKGRKSRRASGMFRIPQRRYWYYEREGISPLGPPPYYGDPLMWDIPVTSLNYITVGIGIPAETVNEDIRIVDYAGRICSYAFGFAIFKKVGPITDPHYGYERITDVAVFRYSRKLVNESTIAGSYTGKVLTGIGHFKYATGI